MPYPKLTEQSYTNFHGINNKVSPYNTDSQEVLDLVNFDFAIPGSLKKREGTTQYISTGVSGRITGLFELQRLNGISLVLVSANTQMYYVQANSLTSFQGGLQNNALFNYTNFVDRTFFTNGNNFMKFDGSTYSTGSTVLSTYQVFPNSFLYSLPKPTFSITLTAANLTGSGSSWTGIFTYTFGWVNERGFHGTVTDPWTVSIAGQSNLLIQLGGAASFNLPIPASYGIGLSAIVDYAGTSTFSNAAMAVYRDSGPGTARFRIGYITMTNFGDTLLVGTFNDHNLTLSIFEEPATINATLMPKYLEVYNNQLFMSGFSQALSTVQFSDVGEPESVQPTNNFEVRTNDGDRITAMRTYFSRLYIFKERSFHSLSGDDPTNFTLTEISDEYGCISGRATAVFDNNLFFLDRKGIVLYNGANISILSTQIQSVFESMNLVAARENAVMIHNRPKNQIWCAIPCRGSQHINCIVVYDYITKGFTTFEGNELSSLQMVIANFGKETPIFGDYLGKVFNFGASFFGDNGNAITCIMQSRFYSNGEQSIQKQFRRLWVNVDEVTGTTSALEVNLLQDYGSSFVITRTIYQNPFQSRIDFGISGKSLSVKIKSFSATDSIVLHGITIASRYQRAV